MITAKLKFLGVDSDPHQKDEMRALILQDKKEYTERASNIIKYCMSDIHYLPALYQKMTNALEELLYCPENPRNIKQFQHNRGQWCVDLAKIESAGIPIDRKESRI